MSTSIRVMYSHAVDALSRIRYSSVTQAQNRCPSTALAYVLSSGFFHREISMSTSPVTRIAALR